MAIGPTAFELAVYARRAKGAFVRAYPRIAAVHRQRKRTAFT